MPKKQPWTTAGGRRAGKSPADFARLLLHVHALIAPRLSILDAVVGMEGNGPSAGDPRPLGLLMASPEAPAHAIALNPEGAIRVSAGLAARLFGWGTR